MYKRNIHWLPLICPQLGTWPVDPGTCPDLESNWRPLSSQDDAQPTQPLQSGPVLVDFSLVDFNLICIIELS